MFCVCVCVGGGGRGSKSAKGGPNPLADMDRGGPNPLADLDRGVQIRGGSKSAVTPGRNGTRATLVGGERSHHYSTPAPLGETTLQFALASVICTCIVTGKIPALLHPPPPPPQMGC